MKLLPALAAIAVTTIATSAMASPVVTFDGANDTATFSGRNNLTGCTAEISPGVFLDFFVSLVSISVAAIGAKMFDSSPVPMG